MDEHRIKYELKKIREYHSAFVFLRHDPPYVRIEDIPTPARNWKTASTKLAIKLPPDYPHTQPVAYAPENLEPRDGVRIRHFYAMKDDVREAIPGGPWNWFCMEPLKWDPQFHATTTILNSFKEWLRKPNSDGPGAIAPTP